MTEWLCRTPTVEEGPAGGARLFYFYRLDRGITIVMDDSGEYQQIRYPQDIDLSTYPQVYRGGFKHIVNDEIKAALIAGDVGVTEDNFTAL